MSGMYIINDLHPERIEKEPIRNGFGRGLVEAGRRNENVVALCADLTESTKMDAFAGEFPERYFEVGVAEQNLVTVASGMAAMGKIPFTSSYAAFSPGRNWEQIRTTVCLNERNVKVVGSHAGVSVGPDGATHQMLEDIALMRVLPHMVVVAPGDSVEAQKATLALAEDERPAYLRLAREATAIFTTSRTPFDLNRAYVLKSGEDVSIIATGTMTYHALIAAEILEKDKINAEVIHVPVIKPLDVNTILASASKTKAVVTAEEAQINGGFGSAVAEVITENNPVPVRRIGIKDRFGESGSPDELMNVFGLSGHHIAMKVHELLQDMGRQ
ncbi:transketolase family protein [Candidatus Saccharibacteria bacterium CPR2]|nr:transketolase family protein [Candidatus Saccharibacteria bacterium CPR2]